MISNFPATDKEQDTPGQIKSNMSLQEKKSLRTQPPTSTIRNLNHVSKLVEHWLPSAGSPNPIQGTNHYRSYWWLCRFYARAMFCSKSREGFPPARAPQHRWKLIAVRLQLLPYLRLQGYLPSLKPRATSKPSFTSNSSNIFIVFYFFPHLTLYSLELKTDDGWGRAAN